jgi:hypothetical protein
MKFLNTDFSKILYREQIFNKYILQVLHIKKIIQGLFQNNKWAKALFLFIILPLAEANGNREIQQKIYRTLLSALNQKP